MAASAIALSMLPEEMEMEVLLHVPVKSVLRFRAVCRRWAALLYSEEFCVAWTKLAESAMMEPAAQLLFLPFTPWKFPRSSEVRYGDGRPLLTIDGVCGQSAVIAPAPCRGLTLLQDPLAGPYHVLNAATRAVATLPPHCQDGPPGLPSSAGLGFDARTKKYKVVRLFSIGDRSEDWFTKIKCEVHTFGRGSDRRWRLPTSFAADSDGLVVPSRLAGAALLATVYDQVPVFVDGFLHWLADPIFYKPDASLGRPDAVVLSFSISEETFSSWIRPPPFDWYVHESHLIELDGRLCMVQDLRRCGASSSLEIWSYSGAAAGGGDVWLLKFRIDLAQLSGRYLLTKPRFVRVVGVSVGKNVIFVATSKGNVVAYDPMHGTLETILQLTEGTTIGERESLHSIPRVSSFKESLTPVY